MIKSILSWINKFQFIFNIAFVVLFLERLYDFIMFFFIILLKHVLYVFF